MRWIAPFGSTPDATRLWVPAASEAGSVTGWLNDPMAFVVTVASTIGEL